MKHRILSLLLVMFAAVAYAQPTVNAGADVYICQGQSTQLNAIATGGTPPYNYVWNNFSSLNDSTIANPTATPTVTTTYVVTVYDNNNLTTTDTITVNMLNAPVVTLVPTPVSCYGVSDGGITLNVTGNSPFTYAWNNTTTTQNQVLLPAGTYTVTVTDMNGCTATASAIVSQPTALIATITNVTDASTCSAFDGSVCVVPTGGTAPYSFAWSNTTNTACISGLNANTYTVTVTDPNACSATGSVTINSAINNLAIVLDSIIDVKCNGQATGAIYITPTGGTAPYTYQWNTGAIVEDHLNLWANRYFVLVTDANGCAKQDTFIVNETDSLLISNAVINASCFGGNNGSISAIVSGGTPPYMYLWSNGSTAEPLLHLPAQVYYVTITDFNGCSASASETVLQPIQLTVGITNGGSDTLLPDTLNTIITGGVAPYEYAWSTGASGNFPSQIIAAEGIYRVTVIDANGCSATDSYTFFQCVDTCVWPGDADYSGVADNNDLLAIGLAYGATGTTRPDQSIGWYSHQSTNWSNYLDPITNYKHIDCNGDGVISSDDTLAILQNYSLTHPRSGPDEVRGGIPALRIRMVPDTLEDGQTVIAHLELGDANNTATNVYALAFTFNFDALVVDTNDVSIAFGNNSWLCNSAADHIDIDKKDAGAGHIYTALTRIDHTTRSGGGEIGKVSMKITTGNINGKDLANYAMNTYITDLRVIDNQGNVLEVDAIGDEATVQYEPTGINEVAWLGAVSLYPNPAREQLVVTSTQIPINSIQVHNLLGETVFAQQDIATANATINTTLLAQGVYVLQLSSGSRVYHAKFIVVK